MTSNTTVTSIDTPLQNVQSSSRDMLFSGRSWILRLQNTEITSLICKRVSPQSGLMQHRPRARRYGPHEWRRHCLSCRRHSNPWRVRTKLCMRPPRLRYLPLPPTAPRTRGTTLAQRLTDAEAEPEARRRYTSACTLLAATTISGYTVSVSVTNPVPVFSPPSAPPVSGSSTYCQK